MKSFVFSFQSFISELKQSDTRLVLFTQWILIVFLLTLTLVSASIQNYLQHNLDNLLGSDVVVSRYQGLSEDELRQLKIYSKKITATQLQTITLANEDKFQQAQLKLVDEEYPIQGKLTIGLAPDAPHQESSQGPKVGDIWIDARLFAALELNMGDKLTLGQTELRLSKIIFHEPDRLLEGHSVAMRAMVHQRSFINPLINDSILYRYLVSTKQELAIKSWLTNSLPDARFISRKSSSHPLSAFWKRVENFLGLAGIILFFMAAVAIDLVSRRQLKQENYNQALYLSMGQPLSNGIKIALTKLLLRFTCSAIPALLVAVILQELFVLQLQSTFLGLRSSISLAAVVTTLSLAFALLLSLQLPYLWQLKNASVISLIRRQSQKSFIVGRVVWGIVSLGLLTVWYSDNILLTSMMLLVFLATVLLILSLTFVVLKTLERITRHQSGLSSFSLFMMNQRLLSKSTQIMGIGICVTLLLFTLMLLRDIGNAMEKNIRVNDGNLVVSKASVEQTKTIKSWSKRNHSPIRQLRPYTRAKLIKINGLSLNRHIDHPSESMALLEKPIRMSWSNRLPKNNKLVDGVWWKPKPENWHQISVEDEIMTDMALNIGDTLTFYIDSKNFEFTIVSAHAFRAGQGSVTFWFQVPTTAQLNFDVKPFYMGSMEVADNAWKNLSEIWQKHPTVGLMPLKELTQNYDKMLALVTRVIVALTTLILIMSVIVIAASIKGFEQDEKNKNGLLLSMGLDKKHCLKLTLFEWVTTALIAAFGAMIGTWLAGVLIYQSQFSLTYTPDFAWLTVTLFIVVLAITGIGLAFSRKSLKSSVVELINA